MKLTDLVFTWDAADETSQQLISPAHTLYVVTRVGSPDAAAPETEYLYCLWALPVSQEPYKIAVTPYLTAPTMETVLRLRELETSVPRDSAATNFGAF